MDQVILANGYADGGTNGGAIFVASSVTLTLTRSTIGGSAADDNSATQDGGGIDSKMNSRVMIVDSTITHNVINATVNAKGGGVSGERNDVVVVSSNVSNNPVTTTSQAAGGGISVGVIVIR